MPRILSIDYGGKRSGLAVTDPLKIIATYAPHGPEAFLRSLPDVRIVPPGEIP